MPRRNRVTRNLDGSITVAIDSVVHTLSEPAFLALMQQAIDTMQAIAGCKAKPPTVD